MKRIGLGIVIFVFVLVGCSQKGNISNDTVIKEKPMDSNSSVEASAISSEKPAAILSELANQKFSIIEDQISDADYDSMVTFGKAFVNLYTGAVAEQEAVSFDNYILNENLLKFTHKMLGLEQKQQLKGGIGVIFGLENEFQEVEIKKLDNNLYFLHLPYSNQGSGMNCKLLVQSDSKSLKIVDMYFGNKDGVDTIATGHPAVRKLDNPKLWDDPKWCDGVFEQLEKYESELSS